RLRPEDLVDRLHIVAAGASAAVRAVALWPRLHHPHHVGGDAVCFLLVEVSGRAHRLHRMDAWRRVRVHWYLAEGRREADWCEEVGPGLMSCGICVWRRRNSLISRRVPCESVALQCDVRLRLTLFLRRRFHAPFFLTKKRCSWCGAAPA